MFFPLLTRYTSYRGCSLAIKAIIGLAIAIHLLFFVGWVDSKYLWGGRFQDQYQILMMEGVSMVFLLIAFVLVLIQDKAVLQSKANRLVTIGLWIFSGLLLLNTVGNMMAATLAEAILGGIATLVLSVCFARLALGQVVEKHE